METPLHYSALIFDSCQDENDSFENLKHDIDLFNQDPNCTQIIVNCLSEWQLKLALSPQPKTMLVQMATHPYVALVNGLKAVTEENVMVVGLQPRLWSQTKNQFLTLCGHIPPCISTTICKVSIRDCLCFAYSTRSSKTLQSTVIFKLFLFTEIPPSLPFHKKYPTSYFFSDLRK